MKVLVTGAGGFIGAWVAEYLHLTGLASPRLGVRNSTALVRTSRFGMKDVAIVDVMDRQALENALEGIDAVLHCAMIPPASESEAARTIVEAMRAKGVRRLIYLSSIAVYGAAEGNLTEDTPLPTRVNPYAKGKQDAERVLLSAKGIDVTLLRPSLVHGPYGKVWTENVARRVVSGRWGTLGKYGEGTCNLVYAPDVAEAMIACVESPATIGKAYNLNGTEQVSWNAYWSRLSVLLTGKELPEIDPRPVMRRARLLMPIRELGNFMLRRNRALVMNLYAANQMTRSVFKATEGNLKLFPSLEEMEGYARVTRYIGDRLTADSGFTPRTSFEKATELSAEWLRLIGVV
nr:NAD(P)-dependent oxidoreductase [Limimaricola sp.]